MKTGKYLRAATKDLGNEGPKGIWPRFHRKIYPFEMPPQVEGIDIVDTLKGGEDDSHLVFCDDEPEYSA